MPCFQCNTKKSYITRKTEKEKNLSSNHLLSQPDIMIEFRRLSHIHVREITVIYVKEKISYRSNSYLKKQKKASIIEHYASVPDVYYRTKKT